MSPAAVIEEHWFGSDFSRRAKAKSRLLARLSRKIAEAIAARAKK
jgi:hypothetical protein